MEGYRQWLVILWIIVGMEREALWFGCNLPQEQEDLMLWCVNHIETIWDDRLTTNCGPFGG
jgi:hypothetical protein